MVQIHQMLGPNRFHKPWSHSNILLFKQTLSLSKNGAYFLFSFVIQNILLKDYNEVHAT